jgi:5-(carboxyamino)imidazole ribonucleotide mutase
MVSVSIVMGSESDRELGEKAEAVLDDFGVENELVVYSAHRSPRALREYVESSEAEVFIAVAGLSAALPGFIAAHTVKPVIGVPKDVKLGGLDSLLSMVQMPPGVPVACVGIDNARNAALLAVEILALSDTELEKKLAEHREKMRG